MNRINQKGMDLIGYKSELIKDYPDLVKKSLLLAIEQMVENKIINLDAYEFVKQDETTLEELLSYLEDHDEFLKTEEEIFAEFEVIREKLDKLLEDKGMDYLQTESVIDKDVLLVTKKFCVDEGFTMNYFGVEEKDLLKLMKRRGFVEKFSVLRLTAIFKAFMEELEYEKDLLTCDVSLVYFDKDENGYSIDVFFELPIEEVEKEEKIEEMCEVIQTIVAKAEKHYEERILA